MMSGSNVAHIISP